MKVLVYLCIVFFKVILMNTFYSNLLCTFLCMLCATASHAQSLPLAKPVHIEVRHPYGANRLMYFWLTDLYTKEEKKVKSQFLRDGVVVLDFELYHPLYDAIIPASNRRIPFYAEPGDSLIITVGKGGTVESYERKDGKSFLYANLLIHDVSNQTFYTQDDFAEDKQVLFPAFVANVTQKMAVAMDSVEQVANQYGFSAVERHLARCNVQMQFALWIFEYAPYKASELLAFSENHQGGWETRPEQEKEMEAIQDLRNYGFMRDMQPDDSTFLASRFFPAFMQSYEHAQVLNYDQYLYAGTTEDDAHRMDSAFVAKDHAITLSDHNSVFMDVALLRRHTKPHVSDDDGSIRLQEVQVLGTNLDQFYQKFGRSEYNPEEVVKKAWAHDVNLRGPISSLLNRKKIRNYKRAKKLIEKLGTDDAEREALMKAYEETQK